MTAHDWQQTHNIAGKMKERQTGVMRLLSSLSLLSSLLRYLSTHPTGRLKELINRGGEKISPPEIDGVLLQHEVKKTNNNIKHIIKPFNFSHGWFFCLFFCFFLCRM